jgi:hypothetical protein
MKRETVLMLLATLSSTVRPRRRQADDRPRRRHAQERAVGADASILRRNAMKKNAKLVLAVAVLACVSAVAMTGDHVPGPFRGDWVPAKAACTSPLKLAIDANLVTFVNGPERVEFKKLEQCFSCMGQGVEDVVLLGTEAMGDGPFMITMDGGKKARPILSVDLSNDKKLAARFPLGTAALKKCS